MTSQTFIEVAAALIFCDKKLLIAQRPPHVHLGGLWEFPGGKREHGESFENCLKREIQEELDCMVEVGELVFQNVHRYPEKTIDIRFYACKLASGVPKPVECEKIEWITRDKVKNFSFPDADLALLEHLDRCNALWEQSETD